MSRSRPAWRSLFAAAALFWTSAFWTSAGTWTEGLAAEPTADTLEFFEKRVRPVLAEHCLKCHGSETQKGGLRLDSRDALMRGGESGPAVMPGEPQRSLIIEAVSYDPNSYQMPPTGKLSDEAIAALTEWVRNGAPWPGNGPAPTSGPKAFDLAERAKHWSFQHVRKPAIPAVQHREWLRNEVDAFILAKLEATQLTPATEAEKRVLLRRVSYDLTGLPPSESDIAEFLNDSAPDAYERLVDRLLASPHYGERWGRHWLDLMRFAETYGHEFDYDIPYAWRYRDYVTRAFNDDLPYDRFVIEHLAGDLLKSPRRDAVTQRNESILATTAYWFSQAKHSPVDIRVDECDTMDNQIDVIGKSFLGLTIACARCHDHKFDPITQRDYYSTAGFLQSSRQTVTDLTPPEVYQSAVDAITTLDRAQRPAALSALATSIEQFADRLPELMTADTPESEAWRKAAREAARKDLMHPLRAWAVVDQSNPQSLEKFLTEPTPEPSSSVAAPISPPFVDADANGQSVAPWFYEGPAFERGDRALQAWQVGSSADRPLRGIVAPGAWAYSGSVSGKLRGKLRSPTFTITTPYIDYWMRRRGGDDHPPRQNKVGQVHLIVDGFQIIRNPLYGHLTFNVDKTDSSRHYRQDVARFLGSNAYIEIEDLDDGEILVDRIEFNTQGTQRPLRNEYVAESIRKRSLATKDDVAAGYQQLLRQIAVMIRRESSEGIPVLQHPQADDLASVINWAISAVDPLSGDMSSVSEWLDQRAQLEAAIPTPVLALTITDGSSEDERLLVRGNPRKPGDPVPRHMLEALRSQTTAARFGNEIGQPGSGRLDWAQAIVDPNNPLAARVMVNRLWQHHFGRGIVPTVDDFGKMGQPPSHPELLDWLASEFIRSGWSLKHMHRLMLTSATYRMSSRPGDARAEQEADPLNVLLHRMNVQRLEAEPIRDALLTIAGRLNERMYGEGVMPHLTPFMEGRGRPGHSGELDGDGRRSIYINVRRNFLSPMFLAFDFPTPFTSMGRRSTSNVPAQALTLMNNPLVVQESRQWADHLLQQYSSPDDRIQHLYLTAFGRVPTPEEAAAALAFVTSTDDTNNTRTWHDLAHVLVNVKEFVFIE